MLKNPWTPASCPSLTESPAVPEEDDDHSDDNDSSPYVHDKVSNLHTLLSASLRAEHKLLHIDPRILWNSR